MTLQLRAVVPERGLELDLHVDPGETVALLGPNGAGKSTVLDLVAGLLRPGPGQVTLGGRVLTRVGGPRPDVHVPPHDRRVALLAQEPLLFPHLSARDNVAFGPRSAGDSRALSRAAAARWLERVGVADLADRRPAQLSGGQAQRVAVARALAAEPQLLLLDEPMAALDVAVTPALRRTLRDVLHGRSALLVTHDVLDALLLADRVVVLQDGHVVEEGPSAHVLAHPRSRFAARLAGLNMVRGTWRSGALLTEGGRRWEGSAAQEPPGEGHQVVAIFAPRVVSVFLTPPGGSPRNVVHTQVTELEPRGDLVRVHAEELSADVTARAVSELGLAPGLPVVLTVKATEVAVYNS